MKLSDLKLETEISKSKSRNCPIIFIDNEILPIISTLKDHGYRIENLKDVSHMNELENSKIIICDIQGVGKKYGSKYEGGHLISEIRKKFPLKYIIGCSGYSFSIEYNRFFKNCDDVIEKHVDIHMWTATIDKAIKSVNDPKYIWNKSRELLLKHNIDLKDIHKLEKAYIKSINKKNANTFKETASNIQNISPVASIIESILTFISFLI